MQTHTQKHKTKYKIRKHKTQKRVWDASHKNTKTKQTTKSKNTKTKQKF